MEETTPLLSGGFKEHHGQEAPPSYDTIIKEQTQPAVPLASPPSVINQQPDPFLSQPVTTDPYTRIIATTTTTTYVTTTETHARERSCCQDMYCDYCPGFIFCYYCVPTSGPADGNCDCCYCLLPTTDCCGGCKCDGGCNVASCRNHPLLAIIVLIILVSLFVALIGIIAFLIYQLGDDKPPAVAKRFRTLAIVFAVVGYSMVIGAGIVLAVYLS